MRDANAQTRLGRCGARLGWIALGATLLLAMEVLLVCSLGSPNYSRSTAAALSLTRIRQKAIAYEVKNMRPPISMRDLYPESTTMPTDPWNRPYRFELRPEPPGYDVGSLGADGQLGGDGEDADIWASKL